MSVYLYNKDSNEPLSHSAATCELLLRMISKWDTSDLRTKQTNPTNKVELNWFKDPAPRLDGAFDILVFVNAKTFLPTNIEEFIPWIKANWDSREVLRFGMAVGRGDITAALYIDAIELLERIVDASQTVYAEIR